MSVPNFSFFSDAHRYQIVYNRDRLLACFYELSGAGIAVVPHFHALTRGDAEYMIAWLRERTTIRYLCREFQTGNSAADIDELARVQDLVGRDLHPIALGARRFAPRLRSLFVRNTVVDSTPFMKTKSARRAELHGDRVVWRHCPTSTSAQRGALLRHNIRVHGQEVAGRLERPAQVSLIDAFEKAVLLRESVRSSRQLSVEQLTSSEGAL